MNKPSRKNIPFEVYNIGSNNPISLMKFVSLIESELQKKAKFIKTKIQKGDVFKTHADNTKIIKKTKYQPKTKAKEGIKKFINWFKSY